MLKLYIGNKNYSSWSMRPWVLLRQAGIPFEEQLVRFDSFASGSQFKEVVGTVNPQGKVPVLVDGDLAVWDSLAICEYAAERFPERQLWPRDAKARARARSVCAEMHAGFSALRNHCPMNIEASLPHTDAYFAPVCARIRNYALPVPGHITDYVRRVYALPGVQAWVEGALAEKDFVEFDEPYRTSR